MGGALDRCGCAEKACCSSCARGPEHATANAPLGAQCSYGKALDIQAIPAISTPEKKKKPESTNGTIKDNTAGELTDQQLLDQLQAYAAKEFKTQNAALHGLEGPDHKIDKETFGDKFWGALGSDVLLDRAWSILDVKHDGKLTKNEILKVIKDLPRGKMTLVQKEEHHRKQGNMLKELKNQDDAQLAMIDDMLKEVDHDHEHINNYKGSRHAQFDLRDFRDFCVKECGSVKEAFANFDIDHGGTLEISELKKHLHKMRYHGHAQGIFAELDKDNDGFITWHEFKHELMQCEEIDHAATKIQAVHRGRTARKDVEDMKSEMKEHHHHQHHHHHHHHHHHKEKM